MACHERKSNGGYGVAVARELVELPVWVRLPVATPDMSIYFITGNKGKLAEVQSILGNVEGLDIDLPEVQSLDAHEIIKAKLEEAKKHQTGEFIVEDTSLYFEALKGLPGPLIKWFMKTIGNDGL